jgi:hypothetical protein
MRGVTSHRRNCRRTGKAAPRESDIAETRTAVLLIPFISNGPFIWWLYPVFGLRGASWFLGARPDSAMASNQSVGARALLLEQRIEKI